MQVLVEGHPLLPMRSRKGLWLLALLTLRHNRPVEREWLAGTLWPDIDQSQAFANLRPILSELRGRLGSQSERLQSPNRHTLYLDLTGAEVDVLAFDTAITSADPLQLAQAVALYRGTLLEGCTEEWVFQERTQREQQCLQGLQQLGDTALLAGNEAEAVNFYRRAVQMDPWGEHARRGWMEALARSGDRNAALQVYREFVELLRDDPTSSPDEQTTALYVRLRAEARGGTRTQAVVSAKEPLVGSTITGYLPHPLTDLIGREEECLEVIGRLRRSRLVTLTGPGGIGKTRLALEVVRRGVQEYSDGAWLVGLDTLSEGKQVLPQIAAVLGVKEKAGRSLLDQVTEDLVHKRLLLVLDNCEHVLEESTRVVGHLLQTCPLMRVLATSREALGITGETAWAVPSLAVPTSTQPLRETPQGAMDFESVRLFVERAQSVQKSFSLTGNNARSVADICSQLEGIPLAIELAAARVKVMTVQQIAARLNNEMSLLTGGSRTAQSRQQTLRATLDWSYALLSEAERLLLRRLSVFIGGWTMEAAEQVCSAPPLATSQIIDLLASLVDKSLVTFEERASEASGRYRMLEMVRQYAAESLQASTEIEPLRSRHRDFFLALAEQAEPQLTGMNQGIWLTRLETEHENLRAALNWCRAEETGAEAEVRMAGALWRFWEVRGHYSKGRTYLLEALGRSSVDWRSAEKARALNGAGVLTYYQGDYEMARRLHEESLSISRELDYREGIAWPLHHLGLMASRQGDYLTARARHEESLAIWRELGKKVGIAWTLHQLASIAREQGEYATARTLSSESLTIWRELKNKQGIAWSLNDLGNVAGTQGDYTAANAYYSESLGISRELGDRQGTAWSLHHLGNIANAQGDYGAAKPLYAESLAIFRELGDKQGAAWTIHPLGNISSAQGDYDAARRYYTECLEIFRELGSKLGLAWSLSSLGQLAYSQGDQTSAWALLEESLHLRRELGDRKGIVDSLEALALVVLARSEVQKAVCLWGAIHALRESIGVPLPPREREQHDRQLEKARSILGEAAFTGEWDKGFSLSWEQAIEAALTQSAGV